MQGATLEHTVNEQLLIDMVHLLADADIGDLPSIPLQSLDNGAMEVIVMKGIVVRDEGRVIVKDHTLIAVVSIIGAEVLDKLRQLPVIFHEQRIDAPQLGIFPYLTYNDPVDVGVGIEGDDQRQLGVEIRIHAAILFR